MQLLLFFVLFSILFLLSRALTQAISFFLFHFTKSHGFAVQLLALLFLPGVIIHELAHWLIASILFVQTGDMEFFPQVHGNSVKLGSVQIAKTDPFRRFAIGIAPVLFGLGVLLAIFRFLSPSFFPIDWKTGFFLYAVFEIGNTMFSSKKDLEGVIGFILLATLCITLLVFLQVPILAFSMTFLTAQITQTVLHILNEFFLFAIGIDVLMLGIISLPLRIFRR